MCQIMTLYNEVNTSVLERSETLPIGCDFKADIFANFDEHTSILQWSGGFTIAMTRSRKCGKRTCYAEIEHSESSEPGKSFEQFAEKIRELFPAALWQW